MQNAAKNKSLSLAGLMALRVLLLLVVALCLGQTRVWGFAVTPQPASGVFESVTPSSIGENYDGCPYDASDSLLAAGTRVWRHVPERHPALADAQAGIIKPYGNVIDAPIDARALGHDLGYTQGSGLTSWTADKSWALRRQQRTGGIIVETVAPEGSVWFNASGAQFGFPESQVLIPGQVIRR